MSFSIYSLQQEQKYSVDSKQRHQFKQPVHIVTLNCTITESQCNSIRQGTDSVLFMVQKL